MRKEMPGSGHDLQDGGRQPFRHTRRHSQRGQEDIVLHLRCYRNLSAGAQI